MRKLMEARRKVDLPRYYCSTSTHATSNETKHYVPRIVRTLTSVGNPLAPHQENGVEEESDSDESWDTAMLNDDGAATRHVSPVSRKSLPPCAPAGPSALARSVACPNLTNPARRVALQGR